MTTLLNYLPVALAIGCYVLAGVFKADTSTHEGLTVLAGLLAGTAIPRLGDALKKAPPAAFVLAVALGGLLAPAPARAQPPVDQTVKGDWKQSLTVGAVATMIDLKTGAVVLGAPLGACWGLEYLPFKSGAAGCFHFAMASKDDPNRYIGSLQLNYREVAGVGLGVMKRQGEAGVPLVLYLSGAVPVL